MSAIGVTARPAQPRRGRVLAAGVAVGVAAAWLVVSTGSASAASVIATWPMTETAGTVMEDVAPPTFENGSIGPLVDLTSNGYAFPGWHSNVTDGGQLQGTVPAGGGIVEVRDPDDLFDPNPGLSISMSLQADLTSQGRLPTRASHGAEPSFNVVQKGRSDSAGGFWKMEIAGAGQKLGRIRCVAKDGSRSAVAVSSARVDDGRRHTVGCELTGGKLTASVDGARTSVSASKLGAIHPGGKWGTSVWIGKKPGSTDPADAFAGTIRDLSYSAL